MRWRIDLFRPVLAVLVLGLSACGGESSGGTEAVPVGEAEPTAAAESAMAPVGNPSLDEMLAYMLPPDPSTPIAADVATSACAEPGRSTYVVPEDFTITYLIGPAHGDWGQPRRLQLDADGRYSLTELTPTPAGSLEPPGERVIREGRANVQSVRNVYAAVLVCNLFALDGNFFDPSRLEGSTAPMRDESVQVLAVRANGRSHAVTVRNVEVTRFLTVRTTLFTETGGIV